MNDFFIPLSPGRLYHAHTYPVGRDLFFHNAGDYLRMQNRLKKFTESVAEILSWCFLPQRIDLVFEIKTTEIIAAEFLKVKKVKPQSAEQIQEFIMERFANLFNSYARGYNNKILRNGGLFRNHLRREEITDNNLLHLFIRDCHRQPQSLRVVENFVDWPYTSFKNYFKPKTRTARQTGILEMFESMENFRDFHTDGRLELLLASEELHHQKAS